MIDGASVNVRTIYGTVLQDKAIEEILPSLLEGACVEAIAAAREKFERVDDADSMALIATAPHNVARHRLENFVEAAGLSQLEVQCKIFAETDISASHALCAASLACVVSDFASVASCLHLNFLRQWKGQEPMADAELFGWCVEAVCALQQLSSSLGEMVLSNDALSIEKANVRMATSVAVIREWQVCMQTFVNRVLRHVLEAFVCTIKAATASARSATPAWEACVENGKLNIAMTTKMMSGKLEAIVQAHNRLHMLLSKLNAAAKAMAVAPRLQAHEVTAEPIAVALATMNSATVAATIARGVEILALAGEPTGPSQAADFMRCHLNERTKCLPKNFWAEFEAMRSLLPQSRGSEAQASAAANANATEAIAAPDAEGIAGASASMMPASADCPPIADHPATPSTGANSSGVAHGSASAPSSGSRVGLKRMRKLRD